MLGSMCCRNQPQSSDCKALAQPIELLSNPEYSLVHHLTPSAIVVSISFNALELGIHQTSWLLASLIGGLVRIEMCPRQHLDVL